MEGLAFKLIIRKYLDFAATFEGNNTTVNLFVLNENVYVARNNHSNKIAKFFKKSYFSTSVHSTTHIYTPNTHIHLTTTHTPKAQLTSNILLCTAYMAPC